MVKIECGCSGFYPRYAMLVHVLAMALCLSVTSQCSVRRNERINLVFGVEAFSNSPTLCFKEIQLSTKIGVLPSGTFP